MRYTCQPTGAGVRWSAWQAGTARKLTGIARDAHKANMAAQTAAHKLLA